MFVMCQGPESDKFSWQMQCVPRGDEKVFEFFSNSQSEVVWPLESLLDHLADAKYIYIVLCYNG